jgi:putative flippase GtrA
MMHIVDANSLLANGVGYTVGVINSFIWNQRWTFKSPDAQWRSNAIRFAIVFGICYSLQLGLLTILNNNLTIDPYYNQLIAMAFYTLINFLLNKYYTFNRSL